MLLEECVCDQIKSIVSSWTALFKYGIHTVPVPGLDSDVVDLALLVIERPDELDESLVRQVDGEMAAEETACAATGAVDVVVTGGVVLNHPELDLPVHVGIGVEGGEAGEHARVDWRRLK